MPETKDDVVLPAEKRPGEGKLGADVYDNPIKFNQRLAVFGPAVLLALGKTGGHLANSNVISGVGGSVYGLYGFLGNRYFRNKGDDTPNSDMGQKLGLIQLSLGLGLLLLEASKIFIADEKSRLFSAINLLSMTASISQGALILFNAQLYGDGSAPKAAPEQSKAKTI